MSNQQDVFGVLVRRALLPVAVVGAVVSLLALLAGQRQALGALMGTFLVVVFFAGTLLLMGLTQQMNPTLAMGVALLAIWSKASLLAVLLLGQRPEWFDPTWFAGVVVAGALLWVVLHVRGLGRARVLVFGQHATSSGRSR